MRMKSLLGPSRDTRQEGGKRCLTQGADVSQKDLLWSAGSEALSSPILSPGITKGRSCLPQGICHLSPTPLLLAAAINPTQRHKHSFYKNILPFPPSPPEM